MIGMDQTNGKWVTGSNYEKQCIATILETEVTTLVNFRSFGSEIDNSLDSVRTPWSQLDLVTDIKEALDTWAPWFQNVKVYFKPEKDLSKVLITVKGETQFGDVEVTI